jgi:hypothetical protein
MIVAKGSGIDEGMVDITNCQPLPICEIGYPEAEITFCITNGNGEITFVVHRDGRIETKCGIFDPTHKRCEWCGQMSPDDWRGACAMCGGPR